MTVNSRFVLALFLGLTMVAVVAEPFHTKGVLTVPVRMIYWSVIIAVSMVAGGVFDEIGIWLAGPSAPVWRAPVLGATMMSVVFTPFVVIWSQLFVAFGAALDPAMGKIFLSVLVPTIAVFAAVHAQKSKRAVGAHLADAPDATEEETTPPPNAQLAYRLTTPQATIFRVSANDHLTEVATDQGIELIRMRFSDAVREMDPVPGCNIHRSHWVALSSVNGLERRQGKMFIKLANGDELPVSRTYRPELQALLPDLF
ncbi:LytTR family DNA-binding domain-containing protein [Marinovum sp. 2_MG-2023]|uniref:LytTR family DNA-binding domain-containing protein n=1 Tax=unclassified Marinovum TaxID=2647166 RepID=UPI0026E3C34E|nr:MULTISPECIES: LytTR family DNA-binding domain-containing protein [unclassified Marinovum]MDO6731686.1 LytTR family DNA-binding domain-containing protein [Marinovum sp. 2_MG-2023]MDO6780938.1 LytTR family DNA-binding domain-containing protein [Marinovum sp. 1_MG-2023]